MRNRRTYSGLLGLAAAGLLLTGCADDIHQKPFRNLEGTCWSLAGSPEARATETRLEFLDVDSKVLPGYSGVTRVSASGATQLFKYSMEIVGTDQMNISGDAPSSFEHLSDLFERYEPILSMEEDLQIGKHYFEPCS